MPQSTLLGCDCNAVTTSVLDIRQIWALIVFYFYVEAHSETTSEPFQKQKARETNS